MKYSIFVAFILSGQILFAQKLSTKTFMLGEEKDFIATKCELTPECDCCSADLILLTASTFVIIDRCVGGDTFYTGTYSRKESSLTLIFKQQVVNEEEDETTGAIHQKLKTVTLKDKSFTIKQCSTNQILEGDGTFYKYGMNVGTSREDELRKELAKSAAFKMLGN